MGLGNFAERIEIQEREIISHASGHAQIWSSKGVFNGQLLEKISALMSLQQQSTTASRWIIRFPDDPRPTYRYSRFVLEDGRIFQPVNDPKKWGGVYSVGIDVECEEQTYLDDNQIQPTGLVSVSEPPTGAVTNQLEYFTGDGLTASFNTTAVVVGDVVVVVDGLLDGGATSTGNQVTCSFVPTVGAIIEVAYASA